MSTRADDFVQSIDQASQDFGREDTYYVTDSFD